MKKVSKIDGHQSRALHEFHVVEILDIGMQRVEPGMILALLTPPR